MYTIRVIQAGSLSKQFCSFITADIEWDVRAYVHDICSMVVGMFTTIFV